MSDHSSGQDDSVQRAVTTQSFWWVMFYRDISVSAITAGLIAVMVGYAGPSVIVFAAAKAVDMSEALLSSWIWAISIGSGLCGVVLSLWFRTPVVIAWSTPGAALLVTSWAQFSHSDAIGAFIASGAAITLLGVTGVFSAVMQRIPNAVVTAMLAGVLFRFGTQVFVSMTTGPWLALPMFLTYLAAKRYNSRYAVLLTLASGLAAAVTLGTLKFGTVNFALAKPVLEVPSFSWQAIIGLAIPLCIVTMASQNAPGIAVLRAAHYKIPVNPLISTTGLISVVFAPFGAHGINLAAITAAICTGKEAHEEAGKRYVAGVACGVFYIVVGIFGATVASLFAALPGELIAVVGGLALFGSMAGGLSAAMKEDTTRESALITFLVAASGISVFGIGAAFWSLVAGVITNFILTGGNSKPAKSSGPSNG